MTESQVCSRLEKGKWVMGSIRPFIRDKSFNPEAVRVMSEAFDRAAAFMIDGDPQTVEILAVRIITVASMGERDPDKLAAAALAGFRTRAGAN